MVAGAHPPEFHYCSPSGDSASSRPSAVLRHYNAFWRSFHPSRLASWSDLHLPYYLHPLCSVWGSVLGSVWEPFLGGGVLSWSAMIHICEVHIWAWLPFYWTCLYMESCQSLLMLFHDYVFLLFWLYLEILLVFCVLSGDVVSCTCHHDWRHHCDVITTW